MKGIYHEVTALQAEGLFCSLQHNPWQASANSLQILNCNLQAPAVLHHTWLAIQMSTVLLARNMLAAHFLALDSSCRTMSHQWRNFGFSTLHVHDPAQAIYLILWA